MNKGAFWKLSYGVYVISTWDNGRATGCTANSAMQITSDPATVAISINHDNYTNGCIQSCGKFAVSILGENTDPGIIGTFGFQSGRDNDKFANVRQELRANMPVVADACAYIVCEVVDKLETSTHTVFLGKVLDADMLKADTAMTYAYYHDVIKGKSPKNAPTYLSETEAPKPETEAPKPEKEAPKPETEAPKPGAEAPMPEAPVAETAATGGAAKYVYVCGVCGYIYEGATPFEELPEDYRCPICRQPKSVFVKKEA